jgi:hypothetical protein
MIRKRTADYPAPPVGSLVGTFNNPGVRYFVRKINEDGSVDVTERPAIPPPRCSVWVNKAFTRDEWARLMDRWVLVWMPSTVTRFPVTRSHMVTRVEGSHTTFEMVKTQEVIGFINGGAVIHLGPAPELTFGPADK